MEGSGGGGLGSYVPANVITLLLYTIDEVLVQEEEEEGKKKNSFEELSGKLHSQMKASHSHNIVVGLVFWLLHAKVEL